jgi:hypothetical protein
MQLVLLSDVMEQSESFGSWFIELPEYTASPYTRKQSYLEERPSNFKSKLHKISKNRNMSIPVVYIAFEHPIMGQILNKNT